jgi:hypothetical protein
LSEPEIKTLVLDVLKPHSPPLPEFARFISELDGVMKVEVSLVEMDERTESIRIVLNCSSINYDDLKEHIGKQGAVIHSVDQVVVEKKYK